MPDPVLTAADAIVEDYRIALARQLDEERSILRNVLPEPAPVVGFDRLRRRLRLAVSEWGWRLLHAVHALQGRECP